DDADEAIGLREIAPQLAAARIDVLREQAELRAARQQRLELLARLLDFARHRERVDVPERTHRESRLRPTEVVLVAIPVEPLAVLELAFDELERRCEARVVRRDETELRQQQRRRVDVFAAVARRERADIAVPRALEDLGADLGRARAPIL